MNIPENLIYSKSHEWVKVIALEAIIGITMHIQEEMGDIVYIDLPEVGSKFKKGDSIAVVESIKTVSDVYMPISGEIIEINEKLIEQPELVNQDPYGQGWFVKIKINKKEEVLELMDSQTYKKFL
ncbi:MAG: glycine cleavage system protein GcvH [bacterium]